MENDNHKYDDIINLVHPTSTRHPRMSMHDRAAQFSAFAALSGHDAAIKETARLTDEREELDEDLVTALNEKIQLLRAHLSEDINVEITYFVPDEKKSGGSYKMFSGVVKKIDEYRRVLVASDHTVIPLDQIREIESELYEKIYM